MRALKNLSLLALAFVAGSAFADITPHYNTFGELPGATFGGKGIPNDPAAISYAAAGADALTIGLIATARHATNPAPTNDGAGTYHAVSGADAGTSNTARWSFDFFMGGTDVDNYTFTLNYTMNGIEYSLDPLVFFASDTPEINSSYQNSENLNFLSTASLFNAGAAGEYGFELVATSKRDPSDVVISAIVVDVPEPASIALVGIALLGAAGASRRRRS